jgi:hypothetical protein
MSDERIFRISFMNRGELYEIFARQVSQGGLFGFIEVEDLLFGERTKIVVDSSEERLKTEFEGVKRIYIPMHAVVRIDEVEKAGPSRITASDDDSKVTSFPVPLYTPSRKTD